MAAGHSIRGRSPGPGKAVGRVYGRVYRGQHTFLTPLLSPLERFIYRAGRIQTYSDMGWEKYAGELLRFNLLGVFPYTPPNAFRADCP